MTDPTATDSLGLQNDVEYQNLIDTATNDEDIADSNGQEIIIIPTLDGLDVAPDALDSMTRSTEQGLPFCDVNSEQVKHRILRALSYKKNAFWGDDTNVVQESDIDLVGPFWITLAVALFFGVTASSWASFKYGNPGRIVDILLSLVIFSGYVIGIPVALVYAQKQYDTSLSLPKQVPLASWICLYGYSLVRFVPAIASWILLKMFFQTTLGDIFLVFLPTLLSAMFVLQNAPKMSSQDVTPGLSIKLLHLLFCLCLASFRLFASVPPGFDFYVLAMTYQPEFCNSQAKCALPGPQETFSLHGLWPEWYNGTWPSTCSREYLDEAAIHRAGTGRLVKYWPSLKFTPSTTGYTGLWEHEWSKHGTCSGLSQAQYLSVTLDNHLRTPRKVRRSIGESIGKTDLKEAFGGRHKVVTLCTKSDSLTEIRVCLAADRFGYPTHRIRCPDFVLAQDTCKYDDVFLRGV